MDFSSLQIVRSAKLLRGNAKTMMPVEPMFSISWALLQFYMGHYMRAQGLTEQQVGYIITIQSLSSIFFSFFGGYLTNKFGRRKTLLVTDLIAYPGSVLIYFFADSFATFALGAFIYGLNVVVNVAWTCFLVEDINTEERIAAYNFINGLSLCSGIFVPISGYVTGSLGMITGQRTILGIAFFVLIARILLRNHFGKETEIGKQVLLENKNRKGQTKLIISGFKLTAFRTIFSNRSLLFAMSTCVLMKVYSVTAAMNTSSLYYVSFLTNTLEIDRQLVSLIGLTSSVFMLVSFLFITPRSIYKPTGHAIVVRVALVIIAVSGLITLGRVSPLFTFLFIAVYAIGYQGMQPMINTLVTDAAKGSDMPSILSAEAILSSSITAVSGTVVGFIFQRNPYWLYLISILMLAVMICTTLASTGKNKEKPEVKGHGKGFDQRHSRDYDSSII